MRRLIDIAAPAEAASWFALRSPARALGLDDWCLGLLRAGATPCSHQAIATRKQRVWMGLGHPVERRYGGGLRRLAFAVVTVLGVFGGATAIASAALGHWPGWATRVYQRWAPPAAVAPRTTAPVSNVSRGRRAGGRSWASSHAEGAPATGTSAVAQAAAALPNVGAEAPPQARERRSLDHVKRISPSSGVALRDETAPVLAAMRALRRDHNPARARALLESYLSEHPNGSLAEEALAMSIEAAVARQDLLDAHRLAERYLSTYPHGPFHVMATRTLADPPIH